MRNYEQGPQRKNSDEGRLTKVSGPLLVRRFSVRQPEMFRVVEAVLAGRSASLDKAALCELAQTVMDLESEGLDGDLIEIGRGSGGTATVIAHAKRRSRPLLQIDPASCEELTGEGPVAFVHVSGAGYDAIRSIFERVTGRLVPGGHMIIDDYKSKEECRRAVDDHFRGKKGFSLVRQSRLHVVKN